MYRILLKDLRTSLNNKRTVGQALIKQDDFAQILGVHQVKVSRMESKGVAEILAEQYEALCNEYGRDEVDRFILPDSAMVVSGNTNRGSGTMTNSIHTHNNKADNQNFERLASALESITLRYESLAQKHLDLLNLYQQVIAPNSQNE